MAAKKREQQETISIIIPIRRTTSYERKNPFDGNARIDVPDGFRAGDTGMSRKAALFSFLGDFSRFPRLCCGEWANSESEHYYVRESSPLHRLSQFGFAFRHRSALRYDGRADVPPHRITITTNGIIIHIVPSHNSSVCGAHSKALSEPLCVGRKVLHASIEFIFANKTIFLRSPPVAVAALNDEAMAII